MIIFDLDGMLDMMQKSLCIDSFMNDIILIPTEPATKIIDGIL